MRKSIIGLVAITIATSAIAQVFIKKNDVEAKQAWPQLVDCPTCRQVLIDLEPVYNKLCGRRISEAEVPFVLAQKPIMRMVEIRQKEALIKLKDAELNLHEADLVTYQVNSKRMKCVSQEEIAGLTSGKPPVPSE